MLGLDTIFSKKEKQDQEYYLGLVLQERSGIAMILHVDNQSRKVTIVQQIPFQFTNHWDTIVEDIDEVLYRLEELTKKKVDKVLYFLYSHLIDFQTKHIKAPYLEKLKIVSQELGLSPLGYIEHHEAVSEYLAGESGPVNAIIVESDLTAISCFVYKNGEAVFLESSAKTQDPVLDVQVVLEKAVHSYSLPSMLVVYSGIQYDELPTKIESHSWPEHYFVEKPTVRQINQNQLQQALLMGVEKQLFSVVSTSATAPSPVTVPPVVASPAPPSDLYPPEEDSMTEEPTQEVDNHVESVVETNEDDTFGFTVGDAAPLVEAPIQQDMAESFEEEEEQIPFSPIEEPPKKFQFPKLAFLSGLSGLNLSRMLPNVRIRHAIVITLGILLIVGSIFATLFYFHKADITLIQKSTSLEKEIQVGKELDVIKKTTKVSASETIDTSGTKYVGEKAKGSITLYNAESKSVTIEKGTILKSGDFQFVLDEDVKIASASGQVTSDGNVLTVTGKATAGLSAKEIGPEYNVKKETKFSIANRSPSAQFAVAANNFTGGSKKEVQIASRQDLTTLKNKVEAAISKKAADAISASGGSNIISKLTEVETTKEKFSSEISEEADSITLTTDANVTVYSYQTNDMKDILAAALASSVPSDTSLANDHISFAILQAKKDGDSFKLTVKTKAKLAPRIEVEKMAKALRGKNAATLQSLFDSSTDIDSYEAVIKTPLPFLKSTVPFFTRNISLQLKLK